MGFSNSYEINIYDPNGKLKTRIIKDYDLIQINEDEYSEQVNNKFGGRPIPPEFEQELPKNYPAFKSFTIDDEGRLFVRTFEKDENGDGYFFDIFDSDGKYLVKLSLWATPQVFRRGKCYTIEDDAEGFQFVRRYKVTWDY